MEKSERSDLGRQGLKELRSELEAATVCRYYASDTDMLGALHTSVDYLKRKQIIRGWIPSTSMSDSSDVLSYDRSFPLVNIEWEYGPSLSDDRCWDGGYTSHRIMTSHHSEGLSHLPLEFTRTGDRFLPWSEQSHPQLKLESVHRTGGGAVPDGSVRLQEPPRKMSGTTFTQDLIFRPGLRLGETVDFHLTGSFPRHKYSRRQDLIAATTDAATGPRTYDWVTRSVLFPMGRLEFRVFLPHELKAVPYGPIVQQGTQTDNAAIERLLSDGSYSVREESKDGRTGVLLDMSVDSPLLNRNYRIAWELTV